MLVIMLVLSGGLSVLSGVLLDELIIIKRPAVLTHAIMFFGRQRGQWLFGPPERSFEEIIQKGSVMIIFIPLMFLSFYIYKKYFGSKDFF